MLFRSVNGLVGEGAARALEAVEASVKVDEAEVQAEGRGQCFEDLAAGLEGVSEPFMA